MFLYLKGLAKSVTGEINEKPANKDTAALSFWLCDASALQHSAAEYNSALNEEETAMTLLDPAETHSTQ